MQLRPNQEKTRNRFCAKRKNYSKAPTKLYENAQGGIDEQLVKTILYFLPLCASKL